MTDSTLQSFRDIFDAICQEPHNWQWIGPFTSQRMFGLSEVKAKEYAERFGGEAMPMPNDDGKCKAWMNY